MKQLTWSILVACLASYSARAQTAVTITSDDLFIQPGLYFRAYSNPAAQNFQTQNVMGSAGPGQVWDFSTGPTDVTYRFDYQSVTNIDPAIATNFPGAKLVEVKTDEVKGEPEYLFFSEVPGKGRTVYGAYAEASVSDLLGSLGALGVTIDPAFVFTPPIVDFPETINFGQEWQSTTTYMMNVNSPDSGDPSDPGGDLGGGLLSSAIQVTETSDLKADASGTIVLPDSLGGAFGQGLRIKESKSIALALDDGSGTLQNIETDYVLNYYWLMPGRGMVAALASTQGQTPPPDNFSTATGFWRMFETNKKATTGTNTPACTTPDPVNDLRIRVSSGQVLLSWSKPNCANQYRLDYSTNPADQSSWKTLTTVTNRLLALDTMTADAVRFYRIVSMK